MKFPTFREFRQRDTSLGAIAKYLSVDLVRSLRELTLGLTKLSFEDNFAGWSTEVTIPAGSEVQITNQLGEVPNHRLITRGGTDSNNIVDGDTEWTAQLVSLKNTGATTVTVTAVFLK